MNIFEERDRRKKQVIELAHKAVGYNWITQEDCDSILTKIKNNTLTIGVIGQMKCGKSTFLNAFIFEDDILPAATTPMTAALTTITYGEEKRVQAEFYTKEEWAEQKMTAQSDLNSVTDSTLKAKIQAAKELYEKSKELGYELDSLLGKTQTDTFENLIEYVGADGKYVSITKSVTVYYPKDYLKGVEIVDTPGFNDPIVSREQRTKEFLKKADVVLMMLYAGQPFTEKDDEILFQHVRQCGIGKVIIGINKYDIPYLNGDSEDSIKDYVKKQIIKASERCNDSSLYHIMKEVEPITLSAEMALLSKIPMTKIESEEKFRFSWNRLCSDFEISTQDDFYSRSHIEILNDSIKKILHEEKDKILFDKPTNAIIAAGNEKKINIEKSLAICENKIHDLETPNEELLEKVKLFKEAELRLNKNIAYLSDDLDMVFEHIEKKGREELEDQVDRSCAYMNQIVDSWGRFQRADSILTQLSREEQLLMKRKLRRTIESLGLEVKAKVNEAIYDFMEDVGDVLIRLIDKFDSREIIRLIERKIKLDLIDEKDYEYQDQLLIFDKMDSFVTEDVEEIIENFVFHGQQQGLLKSRINAINANFNASHYLSRILKNKEDIVNLVKGHLIEELINPIIRQSEDIIAMTSDKGTQLMEAKKQNEELKAEKLLIESRLIEF